MRNKIVQILKKWHMPTRQAAINELMILFKEQEIPCCGHLCCCNLSSKNEK